MINENYRDSDLSFAFMLMQLYGKKAYSDIKGRHSFATIKSYYFKIIQSIEFAVNETIDIVDQNQMNVLTKIIEEARDKIKASKSFSEADQMMIAFQTKLIFQLLGQVPNRGTINNFQNRSKNWKLNSYRQVQYVQSKAQKEKLLLKLIQEKYLNRFKCDDWSDFVANIYVRICHNNTDDFLKFLKKNFPDIYSEVE